MSKNGDEITLAMKKAWRTMWELWPRRFNDAEWSGKSGMYLKRLYDIDPAVIPETAEWCVTHMNFPPSPAEFFTKALQLHRERHPSDPVAVYKSDDPQTVEIATRVMTTQQRLDAMARYILRYCTSGKLSELSAIWALLWEMCETDADRQAIKDGTIAKAKVNDAIRAHRAGRKVGQRSSAPAPEPISI